MKKLFGVLFALAGVLLVMAGVALGADAEPVQSGWAQFVTKTIEPVIVSVAGTLVSLLSLFLCRFVTKKTGIEISQASQAKLEGIAMKAVLMVEEKAVSSIKKAGEKWNSYQKHQEAINHVLSLAPSISREQADMLVHWAVAKIPGVGATGILGASTGVLATSALGYTTGGESVADGSQSAGAAFTPSL